MPQTFDTNTANPWDLCECPYKFVDTQALRLLTAVNDADKGHLPVVGGMLDQTPAFTEASRLIRSERAAYKT